MGLQPSQTMCCRMFPSTLGLIPYSGRQGQFQGKNRGSPQSGHLNHAWCSEGPWGGSADKFKLTPSQKGGLASRGDKVLCKSLLGRMGVSEAEVCVCSALSLRFLHTRPLSQQTDWNESAATWLTLRVFIAASTHLVLPVFYCEQPSQAGFYGGRTNPELHNAAFFLRGDQIQAVQQHVLYVGNSQGFHSNSYLLLNELSLKPTALSFLCKIFAHPFNATFTPILYRSSIILFYSGHNNQCF